MKAWPKALVLCWVALVMSALSLGSAEKNGHFPVDCRWIPAFAGMTPGLGIDPFKSIGPSGAGQGHLPRSDFEFLARDIDRLATSAPRAVVTSGLWAADEQTEEPEKHAAAYKWVNFLILVGALGYLLRKPTADYFSHRSSKIRKGLDEGRRTLESAEQQLKAVEEKLRGLGDEIQSFRASAAEEMAAERQRLVQATEREGEKILQSARARIETAARTAKVELQAAAATDAVALAEEVIREKLDAPGRERLVARFVEGLETGGQPSARI